MTPYADQNESSLSLWTANCESFVTLVSFRVAQQRDVLRGLKSGIAAAGACSCETVAAFMGSWEVQRSGTAKLTSRLGAPGRSSGVMSHARQNETSTSLGAAKCETVATAVGFWVAQRRDVPRGSE